MSRCYQCMWRGEHRTGDPRRPGCAYIQITGHSRLKEVYERLGVDHLTREAKEALHPANCTFYKPGKQRIVPEVGIVLEGSRRLEKREKEVGERRTPPSASQTPPLAGEAMHAAGGGKKSGEPVPKKQRACKWDKEAAMKLWKQGLRDNEIGAKLGVSDTSIRNWRSALQLTPNYRCLTQNSELIQLYSQGKTDREIAAELGMHLDTVRHWRNKRRLKHHPEQKEREKTAEMQRRRALYDAGKTDKEISEMLGLRLKTVITWRWNLRLPANKGEKKRGDL